MNYRFKGPLGSSGRPPDTIDSGTSALTEHRAPGVIDALKAATRAGPLLALGPAGMPAAAAYTAAQLYYAKNLQALAEVRDRALVLAPAAIAEETGLNDIGKLLQSLLYGLLASLLALAGTTALGGVIGGVIGFFFGVGAGAAPGAVVGAKVGFDLGLALLTWVGVGFLAASIATGFGELIALQTSAVRRGWAAGNTSGSGRAREIEAAAQDLARAAGVFVRLILEGIVAYLTRGAPAATTRTAMGTVSKLRTAGSEAVAAETVAELVAQLRRSKLGKGFADWVELNWKKLVENPKLRRSPQAGAATGATGASKAETPNQARRAADGKKSEPVEEQTPAKTKPPPPAAQQIKELPQYKGMSKAQIEKSLAEQGYSRVPSKDGTGSVWTKAGSDGNTSAVRLDDAIVRTPPKNFADEVPHLHKELVPTSEVVNGNYPPSAALKFDDLGNVVTGPNSQTAAQTHIPIVW